MLEDAPNSGPPQVPDSEQADAGDSKPVVAYANALLAIVASLLTIIAIVITSGPWAIILVAAILLIYAKWFFDRNPVLARKYVPRLPAVSRQPVSGRAKISLVTAAMIVLLLAVGAARWTGESEAPTNPDDQTAAMAAIAENIEAPPTAEAPPQPALADPPIPIRKLTQSQFDAVYRNVPAQTAMSYARPNEKFEKPTLDEVNRLVGQWCATTGYGNSLTIVTATESGLGYRNGTAGDLKPIVILASRFFDKTIYYLSGSADTFYEMKHDDSFVESVRSMNDGDDNQGFVYFWERC